MSLQAHRPCGHLMIHLSGLRPPARTCAYTRPGSMAHCALRMPPTHPTCASQPNIHPSKVSPSAPTGPPPTSQVRMRISATSGRVTRQPCVLESEALRKSDATQGGAHLELCRGPLFPWPRRRLLTQRLATSHPTPATTHPAPPHHTHSTAPSSPRPRHRAHRILASHAPHAE